VRLAGLTSALFVAIAPTLLIPEAGQAQRSVASLRADLLRPGTDSQIVSGIVAGAPAQPSDMVYTLVRGTGNARATLTEVHAWTIRSTDGSVALTVIDSTVADATDLRLRRAHSVQLDHEGRTLVDASVSVSGAAVQRVARQSGRTDTTRAALNGEPPHASPFLIMRAAPLSTEWRATFAVFVPNAIGRDQVKTVEVDSVRLDTLAGRRVWVAHARLLPDLHWSVIIDSVTRDLLQFTASQGDSLALTFRSNRFHSVPVAAAALEPAIAPLMATDRDAMRPVAGHYYLEGVREVGSELVLQNDGTFEFMLAYGALDETGGGTWRMVDGAVVLNTPGNERPPSVRIASASGIARDSMHVLVVDSAGRPLSGITLDFLLPDEGRRSAQSSRTGYTLHFAVGRPPTAIGVGVDMLHFRTPFDIGGKPRASYRFIFTPGDLGHRRFVYERLTVEPGRLVMRLNGRPLQYVRH
jgi:hypothetical protein